MVVQWVHSAVREEEEMVVLCSGVQSWMQGRWWGLRCKVGAERVRGRDGDPHL